MLGLNDLSPFDRIAEQLLYCSGVGSNHVVVDVYNRKNKSQAPSTLTIESMNDCRRVFPSKQSTDYYVENPTLAHYIFLH